MEDPVLATSSWRSRVPWSPSPLLRASSSLSAAAATAASVPSLSMVSKPLLPGVMSKTMTSLSVPLSSGSSIATLGSTSSGATSVTLAPCQCHSTEVLVVGNGPCGMALSYVLSGHAPTYCGETDPHPNKILHERLMVKPGLSLLEQVCVVLLLLILTSLG